MEYNYFKIILSRCSGQFYCKSTDEINKAINKLSIGIGLIDYYFDSNDYSNPIKLNLNMDDEFPLVSSFKKSVKLKMRRNDVKDRSNSLPFASSDQYSFFSLGTASQVLFSEQPDGVVFEMTISLDSKYQEIDRTVFTLGDLFGKIGGVDSILCMIASFLVGIFTPTIYNASLISDLYSVLKRQNNFDLQDQFPQELQEEEEKCPDQHIENSPKIIKEPTLMMQRLNNKSSLFVENSCAGSQSDCNIKVQTGDNSI